MLSHFKICLDMVGGDSIELNCFQHWHLEVGTNNFISKEKEISTYNHLAEDLQSYIVDIDFIFLIHSFLNTKMPVTFTATRYLPPCRPHVGPLDPVTFKEAKLFTCIRVH